jgi:hypothetical protein
MGVVMNSLIALLKALAVILVSFFLVSLFGTLLSWVGLIVSAGLLIAAVACLIKPTPAIWLGNRATSGVVMAIALFGLWYSYSVPELNRLKELKKTDVQSYLAELKKSHSPTFESELKSLDKVGYDKFVEDRKAKEKDEATARAKIASDNALAKAAADKAASITKFRNLYINMPREEFQNMKSNEWEVKFENDSADLIQRDGDRHHCASISFDKKQQIETMVFRKCFSARTIFLSINSLNRSPKIITFQI